MSKIAFFALSGFVSISQPNDLYPRFISFTSSFLITIIVFVQFIILFAFTLNRISFLSRFCSNDYFASCTSMYCTWSLMHSLGPFHSYLVPAWSLSSSPQACIALVLCLYSTYVATWSFSRCLSWSLLGPFHSVNLYCTCIMLVFYLCSYLVLFTLLILVLCVFTWSFLVLVLFLYYAWSLLGPLHPPRKLVLYLYYACILLMLLLGPFYSLSLSGTTISCFYFPY